MWGGGASKEREERVALRELWEIKSPTLFIELRRPWELSTCLGTSIVKITVFQAVGPVWRETRVELYTILSSLREGGVIEMNDSSLKGDDRRGMQAKCKEIR